MAVNIKRENDLVIYVIDKDSNTFEVETARQGFERNNQFFGLIRDSDDLFTCVYPPQTMYEYCQNDNNYTVSNSSDITKVRTLEKEAGFLFENIITVNYDKDEYSVLKYVHTIKRSTIEAKTYSNISGGKLSYEEAKEIILSCLDKIKSINSFKPYINMEKIELFFKEFNISNKSYR